MRPAVFVKFRLMHNLHRKIFYQQPSQIILSSKLVATTFQSEIQGNKISFERAIHLCTDNSSKIKPQPGFFISTFFLIVYKYVVFHESHNKSTCFSYLQMYDIRVFCFFFILHKCIKNRSSSIIWKTKVKSDNTSRHKNKTFHIIVNRLMHTYSVSGSL